MFGAHLVVHSIKTLWNEIELIRGAARRHFEKYARRRGTHKVNVVLMARVRIYTQAKQNCCYKRSKRDIRVTIWINTAAAAAAADNLLNTTDASSARL